MHNVQSLLIRTDTIYATPKEKSLVRENMGEILLGPLAWHLPNKK